MPVWRHPHGKDPSGGRAHPPGGPGYRRGVARQQTTRYRAVLLVVLGVIVVGLGAMLFIGVLQGDDTDHIDPQNGQVVTLPG
jgi:hypothetical protein